MTLYYFFISRIPFSLFLFKYLISPLFNANRNDMSLKRKAEETLYDVANATSFLDLPELALDCILERLSPESLRAMSLVCSSMRERCLSDRLWERHMSQKWGRVVGRSAHREWQWHIATTTTSADLNRLDKSQAKQKGFMRLLSLGWPFSWMRPRVDGNSFNAIDDDCTNSPKPIRSRLTVDSIMVRYLALETGKFCFPAQVYNRENGHVGFMLSCYDAQMSYDPKTDTFEARYPPHGRRAIAVESGVPWERVRAPPVDTPPHDLHTSDCLHILKPGHHIEIQWRRNKDFPYGWWYGVVGHLESCDGNEKYCRCHENDTVVLEFNQYTPGSGWRHTTVNRKDHREEGNEVDGFYGGIRKLSNDREISTWKQLWPAETLD